MASRGTVLNQGSAAPQKDRRLTTGADKPKGCLRTVPIQAHLQLERRRTAASALSGSDLPEGVVDDLVGHLTGLHREVPVVDRFLYPFHPFLPGILRRARRIFPAAVPFTRNDSQR
jgi:hypothetical protein